MTTGRNSCSSTYFTELSPSEFSLLVITASGSFFLGGENSFMNKILKNLWHFFPQGSVNISYLLTAQPSCFRGYKRMNWLQCYSIVFNNLVPGGKASICNWECWKSLPPGLIISDNPIHSFQRSSETTSFPGLFFLQTTRGARWSASSPIGNPKRYSPITNTSSDLGKRPSLSGRVLDP